MIPYSLGHVSDVPIPDGIEVSFLKRSSSQEQSEKSRAFMTSRAYLHSLME